MTEERAFQMSGSASISRGPARIPPARQTDGPAPGAATVSTASTGGRAGWSSTRTTVPSPPTMCTGVTTGGAEAQRLGPQLVGARLQELEGEGPGPGRHHLATEAAVQRVQGEEGLGDHAPVGAYRRSRQRPPHDALGAESRSEHEAAADQDGEQQGSEPHGELSAVGGKAECRLRQSYVRRPRAA